MPSPHLRQLVLRSVAWGFSSSGVERTFSRGGWLKGRREVTVDLASDELWATHFDGNQDEFLGMKQNLFENDDIKLSDTSIHWKKQSQLFAKTFGS